MGAQRPQGKRLRYAAIGIGLAAGLAIAFALITIAEGPDRRGTSPEAQAVRFIRVTPVDFKVHVRGYGVAQPAETWTATATVPGRVVRRHPDLASGNLIEAGTELLRIDPSRYQLAVEEARAELGTLVAELGQLDTEADNTEQLLALERRALDLAAKEMDRLDSLYNSGDVSATRRDEQRRATVQQRQAVRALENELALIPFRRQRLEGRIDQVNARLSQAREDLEDTRFVAPFDLRVRNVAVERNDHAASGQQLFRADSIATAEVVAHVPVTMVRRLVGRLPRSGRNESGMGALPAVDLGEASAEVHLVGAEDVVWRGRITRIADGLDPRSRTVRVVVAVDEPYVAANPPERPPLVRDMYVQVRLASRASERRLVVPAAAVHQGEVYLVNGNDRLERRSVRVAFTQHDAAVISAGLEPGDRVIVDDPTPAIGGMPLMPHRDEALERRLGETAAGAAR